MARTDVGCKTIFSSETVNRNSRDLSDKNAIANSSVDGVRCAVPKENLTFKLAGRGFFVEGRGLLFLMQGLRNLRQVKYLQLQVYARQYVGRYQFRVSSTQQKELNS